MNAWVSPSPFPRAHPPRSNPFPRSSSEAWPFPCSTPSTVTWVMVVSFMFALPFLAPAPCGRPHPGYERHRPDPTPHATFGPPAGPGGMAEEERAGDGGDGPAVRGRLCEHVTAMAS